MEPSRTDAVAVRCRDDGIVQFIYPRHADVSLADARRSIERAHDIARTRPWRALVSMQHVRSVQREARDFFASRDNAEYHDRAALVVGSPVSRMIGNFFVAMSTPPFPTRLFTNEDDAVDWLLSG